MSVCEQRCARSKQCGNVGGERVIRLSQDIQQRDSQAGDVRSRIVAERVPPKNVWVVNKVGNTSARTGTDETYRD